jgi:adenosyl cobinamide kinase/adenosyl cobinamide phosphate guanylyltransferase
MALSGKFEGMPPQDLLQWISRGNKHGILTVNAGNEVIHIRFENGEVVGINSSRSKDRLGALLVRKGIIDLEQLKLLRQDHADQSILIGELLLQKNLITPEILHQALNDQVQDITFYLLTKDSGKFNFEERALKNAEKLIHPVNTSNLLLEGARRIDEWHRIKQVIPSNRIVFKKDEEKQPDSGCALELKIWDFLSKPRMVEDVLEQINASEFFIMDALRKMVNSGLIERDKAKEDQYKTIDNEVKKCIERAKVLIKDQGYHESLICLSKALGMKPNIKTAKNLILDVKIKVLHDARRMITSPKVIPKVRRTFASLSPENLTLSSEEAFVFSRIDGNTDVKTLQYLTNLCKDEIYIILHKFSRMGLIYLDKNHPSYAKNLR